MEKDQVPFVLLHYSPGSVLEQASGVPVLVLFSESGLEVHLRSGWMSGLDQHQQEYLSELMKFWRSAPREDVPDILEELAELRIGPLQVLTSGVADPQRRAALLATVSSPAHHQ